MKLNKNIFIPHRWIDLKGLTRLFSFLFYIPLIVFIYSFIQWIWVLFTPAKELALYSAPVKQLWFSAAVQSLLIGVIIITLAKLLKTLAALAQRTTQK